MSEIVIQSLDLTSQPIFSHLPAQGHFPGEASVVGVPAYLSSVPPRYTVPCCKLLISDLSRTGALAGKCRRTVKTADRKFPGLCRGSWPTLLGREPMTPGSSQLSVTSRGACCWRGWMQASWGSLPAFSRDVPPHGLSLCGLRGE